MTPSPSTPQCTAIIALFPELLGIGGVQESGRQCARAIDELAREHGWRVQILSLNDTLGEHCLPSPTCPLSFRAFGRRKTFFALWMIRKAMSFARDGALFVVAAHPNLALPAWLIRVLSRSAKTIVMTHGVEVWTRLPFLRWKALSNADLILAPSTDTVRKLIDVQGLASNKIRKLAWPLNPDFLAMADSPQRFQVPRDFPQGRVVLTVGRWASAERYKGMDELIHATTLLRSKVDNLHLVVVGQGDDLPRLRKLAIEEGGAKSVHFLGRVSREELAACYAGAEVFAMPSSGEGFGLVFLEAMAFAKPIVGTCRGGTTDLVEHDVNGLLVPSGDVQRLANALENLLMNDSFRTRMGQRGAELVRDKYGFGKFKIEFERILGSPPIATMVSWKHP